MRIVLGIFIVLHGLVHLFYVGQSQRLFELQPGMTWPDGSWIVSGLLGDETSRVLASVLYALAAIGFVTGGIGGLISQGWARPVVTGATIFSVVIIVLFWDGTTHKLADQGAIAVLINLAILAVLFVWKRAS
jgi:hypothetical protein